MVNFPTRIPGSGSHSPALLDFCLSSNASICSTLAFPPLGNSDHVAFHQILNAMPRADWDVLCDHLRDVPWEHIFKRSASAVYTELFELVQVGTDVYIPHRKY